MRKYIILTAILFGCSFLLIACSSDDKNTNNNENDQEAVEEEKDNTNNNNNEENDPDLMSTDEEDIKFGDKIDMGEETAIEDILSFIDNIKFPDIKLEDDDRSRFFARKEKIKNGEPTYFLNFNYHGNDANGISTFLQFYAYTNEEAYEEKASEATETKTLSNGTEVRWEVHEDGSKRAFVEDGDYYYMLTTPREEEKMSEETFLKTIEGLSEENYLYEKVSNGLEESVENHFVMPTYFPENIKLDRVTINDIALSFYYWDSFNPESGDGGGYTSITHSVSNELESDEETYEEIELPSGRKAFIQSKKDMNYDAKLYMKEEGLNFDISATNIERPLEDENLDHLKGIADSIETPSSE